MSKKSSKPTYNQFLASVNQKWGYIIQGPPKPYTAPLFIGEFGTSNPVGDLWWGFICQYLRDSQANWAYFALTSTKSLVGGYGLMSSNYSSVRWDIMNSLTKVIYKMTFDSTFVDSLFKIKKVKRCGGYGLHCMGCKGPPVYFNCSTSLSR